MLVLRRSLNVATEAVLGLGLVVILAGPAAAQGAAPATAGAQADVEAGVDVANRVTNKGVTNVYTGGFHAGASWRIKSLISVMTVITADFDKRDAYTANIYSYAGGARFDLRTPEGRVRPFAQVVLGLGQDNGIDAETPNKTNYYPYLSPGIGTDLALHDRVSVRIRLDVPILMRYSDSYVGTRFSIGIAIPLGGS
jgi:hypothetical protein